MKTEKLPKVFGKKWVKALRSGKHKKITGTLEREGCYCANGLAYKANGLRVKGCYFYVGRKQHSGYIQQNNPIPVRLFERIVHLNDHEEKSFPEIADWIEQNVEFI